MAVATARVRKSKPAVRTRTGRKPKAAVADYTPEEAAILAKYPTCKIVPGSWKASGGRPAFGAKATIIIRCTTCDTERTIATSDAFQVRYCLICKKDVVKNQRATRAAKKKLK